MKLIPPFVIACLVYLQTARGQQIGTWFSSASDLPVYQYTGSLPFAAADKNGKDANLPEDPYLLGNYRIGLLTHVNGTYQLLTAERAWARINAADQTNYGWNDASIAFTNNKSGSKVALIGVRSMAADPAAVRRTFWIGFARYTYQLANQVSCTRVISTRPSPRINTGNSAFVITVMLHNYSPDIYAGRAESHLNSVVVLATFPQLIRALEKSKNA